MWNSLRTAAGRGITVLVGSAVFALVASGAADATTTVNHGADKSQSTAYSMRAFEGERDGSGAYADAAMNILSGRAVQSIAPLGPEDICDITPACYPPPD